MSNHCFGPNNIILPAKSLSAEGILGADWVDEGKKVGIDLSLLVREGVCVCARTHIHTYKLGTE